MNEEDLDTLKLLLNDFIKAYGIDVEDYDDTCLWDIFYIIDEALDEFENNGGERR